MNEHLEANHFLIEVFGDGQRQSVSICNAEIKHVKQKLADLLWYGTYEEAMEDEMVGTIVNSLDDPDNWNCGVWSEDGEQCWYRVSTVDEDIGSDELPTKPPGADE